MCGGLRRFFGGGDIIDWVLCFLGWGTGVGGLVFFLWVSRSIEVKEMKFFLEERS